MQQKSQALQLLETFSNYVQNHFNTSIKVLRIDNALEFDSQQRQDFFGRLGIIHQTTCVDKLQQNGVAERKHRDLLEMARALRLQATLPLYFWGHCILTATHLINKLPTPVLGNLTPYEALLQKRPDYSMLRVFGCLAFAANPDRIRDKLYPKGVPCVFLGYPQSQKGYKLLNLLTHKMFVSQDVTFVEHIFPYSPYSYAQCMQPIPSVQS